MRFVRDVNGNWELEKPKPILNTMNDVLPISTCYMIDIPSIKKRAMEGLGNKSFAVAPVTAIASQGIFWKAFLVYIFPWMLDIAKVYCAIRIAQAFYQEKRGGRDESSGLGAVMTYGKWYLVFWMVPILVELIDQIGGTMFNELKGTPIDSINKR